MKKISRTYFISFILLTSNMNVLAQSSKFYTTVYILNKIIDEGEYVNDERINKKQEINTNHLIYTYNFKKDTIVYYDFYGSEISTKKTPSICTLIKRSDTLFLSFKRNSYTNKIRVNFNTQEKSISINDKDIFYLNGVYYKYLYKSVNQSLNIKDLVDLLEDFLEDYNLEDLKFISSNEKYKHRDFKLLKAYMESYRSQATDYLDKWNIKFSYNKKGVLNYVLKKSAEDDQSLEKKLIISKDKTFKYLICRNNESRLIVNSEESFNTSKNSYNSKISAFQVGLGKETKYEIKRIVYKVINSKKIFLDQKKISEIITLK
ncbi:hypothetical protein [Flavobacterium ginsenosidimutans]|uniref:hypothetical protein n=1 Tax=Flavobacterium ginsenosidimutans TaxID=687844 RepID=UPI003D976109